MVYDIECSCGVHYIGHTGQHLIEGFKQHQKRGEAHSAISKHLVETNHQITFDKTNIVTKESNRRAREVKEMIYIRQNKKN